MDGRPLSGLCSDPDLLSLHFSISRLSAYFTSDFDAEFKKRKTTIGEAPFRGEDSHLNYMGGGERQRNVPLKKGAGRALSMSMREIFKN